MIARPFALLLLALALGACGKEAPPPVAETLPAGTVVLTPARLRTAKLRTDTARLVEEKSANLTRLGVVSRQAVVRLTGTVSSEEQKALAERVAKGVSGVQRVVNALDVRPAPG
jgi:hypothetical protein